MHTQEKKAEEEYKKQESELTYTDREGNILPPSFYEMLNDNVRDIAMSYIIRPQWDRCVLNAYGAEVHIEEDVMNTIMPEFVNGNTATMQVFLVRARKI